MTKVITSILTDKSFRSDQAVEALLMTEAEIAGPWGNNASS